MLSVQFGTGGTSRPVPLPHKIHGAIMRQFEQVRALHQADLKRGYDGVFLPASFEQKAKSAARELVWQWFFPAQRLTFVEATRELRRSHVHASDIQRAIKAAPARWASPSGFLRAVFRGWADRVRMQITDAFLALPSLMIAVTVISMRTPSLMPDYLLEPLQRLFAHFSAMRAAVGDGEPQELPPPRAVDGTLLCVYLEFELP